METLISIDDLIKEAKNQKITFGKGDPYNRLRYYTKMGWLPHMVRKASKGHYPKSAIKRLILIEKLKMHGLSNEEINVRLNTKDRAEQVYAFIRAPEAKAKFLSYGTFFLLISILAIELGFIRVGKVKSDLLPYKSITDNIQILDSGEAFVSANRNKVFVDTDKVTKTAKVHVTFNDTYSPATRYWVSEKEANEGFYLELDAPTAQDTPFTWWLSL